METLLFAALAAGCAPSLFYLGMLVYRRLSLSPKLRSICEDPTQLILFGIALFCFGWSMVLVVWSVASPPPYRQLEKLLVIALLFVLMGILCLQVLQFVRYQQGIRRRTLMRERRKEPGTGRRKKVVRPYALTDSKG